MPETRPSKRSLPREMHSMHRIRRNSYQIPPDCNQTTTADNHAANGQLKRTGTSRQPPIVRSLREIADLDEPALIQPDDSPNRKSNIKKKIDLTAEALALDNETPELIRLLETYGVLSRWLTKAGLLQTQLLTEMSKYPEKLRFLEESIINIADDTSCQEDLCREVSLKSREAQEQLISDQEALEEQSRRLTRAITQTMDTNWRLGEAKQNFLASLRHFVTSLPGCASWSQKMQEAESQADELLSEASDEVPELARQYFDASSHSQGLCEQLFELKRQHAIQRRQRSFLRDQEREPSIPDSEFERQHTSKRWDVENQIEEASRRENDVLRKCEEQRLDLETLRYRRRGESRNEASQQARSRTTSLSFTDELKLDEDTAKSLMRLGDDYAQGMRVENVESWLADSESWARLASRHCAEASSHERTSSRNHLFIQKDRLATDGKQCRNERRCTLRSIRSEPVLYV